MMKPTLLATLLLLSQNARAQVDLNIHRTLIAQNAAPTSEPPAADATADPNQDGDDSIDDEDADSTVVKEAPPKPEFPYPGAQTEEGFTPPAISTVPTPAPTVPESYSSDNVPVEPPISINEEGTYFYPVVESPKDSSSTLKFGVFAPPPHIINPKNQFSFAQIYGNTPVPALFFDYEWEVLHDFGGLGLKIGTGLFTRVANGEFAQPVQHQGQTPDERFTFVMFPNTVSGIYKFQYAGKQPIVPYAEGGAGYFTFAETRDDGKPPKFGAAAVTFGAGGVNFLMDWLDPHAIRNLDTEYGINHVWLQVEYKLVIGLNSQYDFTSSVITSGLNFEF